MSRTTGADRRAFWRVMHVAGAVASAAAAVVAAFGSAPIPPLLVAGLFLSNAYWLIREAFA